jgi:hypothetical protein
LTDNRTASCNDVALLLVGPFPGTGPHSAKIERRNMTDKLAPLNEILDVEQFEPIALFQLI